MFIDTTIYSVGSSDEVSALKKKNCLFPETLASTDT